MARRILPWFGGSSAVWSTCLVFYQVTLLAGYLYASVLVRFVRPKLQTAIHLGLLALSLSLLPIGPSSTWETLSPAHPSWLIFRMLALTIGPAFVALSATSPLLQAWLARGGFPAPYRLFALSNLASLAALIAYPSVVEPALGTRAQSFWWSVLYAMFAALCAAVAWSSSRLNGLTPAERNSPRAKPSMRPLQWFALAACGSMLLLSVTNHITENVAAVPFLWVLPLAVYLLSFILTFGTLNIYRPATWSRLFAFALGTIGYAVYGIDSVEAIQVSLPVFLAGLLICCVFCHGELNRLRPSAEDLTRFYLFVASGGAAGALFVGMIAPQIFPAVYELPVALILTALTALVLSWSDRLWSVRLLWFGLTACMIAVLVLNIRAYRENSLSLRRSFYGSLRVIQTPRAGPDQQRMLYHGTIEHGAQFVLPPKRLRPTTYYGPDSGIGILLRESFRKPKKVGLVGLGIGTLAAYGNAGDELQFFEINSQIVDIAHSLFSYLSSTPAHVKITLGDARLSLQRNTGAPFDVLVLDAFSGDAIPVHLLTREAVALYKRHLRPDGVLAFHVSNNFLDLAPVVRQLAGDAGYRALLVHNHSDQDEAVLASDWVLVTNNQAVLENAAIQLHSKPIEERAGLRLWTDDYNNLLQVLKTPTLRK